jgi:hypothetical protein
LPFFIFAIVVAAASLHEQNILFVIHKLSKRLFTMRLRERFLLLPLQKGVAKATLPV